MNPQDLPPELIQMIMAQQQMGPGMGMGGAPQPGPMMGSGVPPQMLAQQLMQPRPVQPGAMPQPAQMAGQDFY